MEAVRKNWAGILQTKTQQRTAKSPTERAADAAQLREESANVKVVQEPRAELECKGRDRARQHSTRLPSTREFES